MPSVVSIATWFDETFGATYDEMRENKGYVDRCMETYGFLYRCLVSKDIPPRHSMFSFIRGMGVTKYDEIFSKTIERLPDSWLLAVPERHTSIQEQQALIHTLAEKNKELGNPMKELDILTSSPMIISDSVQDSVRIIGFPDGKPTYDQDYMSF